MKTQRAFLQKLGSAVVAGSFFIAASAQAQSGEYIGGYKQVKRLGGTNQSICRPAINSATDLQSFALNQHQDVVDILSNAGWSGNPDDVFAAIEAGNFTEKSFPVGTKLAWMGMRKNGKVIAANNRQWAGKQAFDGFELNLVSNCVQHQLVIPKACCNLSLVSSSPVQVSTPVVSVNKDGQNATITVNTQGAGNITTLTRPDGSTETLTLTDGRWTGTLPPGNYSVEARSATDCGESAAVAYTFGIAAPMVAAAPPMAAPAGGFFVTPFLGRQVRLIDPLLVGVQAGILRPINERMDWFVQGGGSYNTDVKELSLFVDTGLEFKVGNSGFIGGGLGLWDINNSDDLPNSTSPKQDVSYFIHGGADLPMKIHNRSAQWFAEARIFDDFTDDISHHNILKLGIRVMH